MLYGKRIMANQVRRRPRKNKANSRMDRKGQGRPSCQCRRSEQSCETNPIRGSRDGTVRSTNPARAQNKANSGESRRSPGAGCAKRTQFPVGYPTIPVFHCSNLCWLCETKPIGTRSQGTGGDPWKIGVHGHGNTIGWPPSQLSVDSSQLSANRELWTGYGELVTGNW